MKLATNQETGQTAAVKIIKKPKGSGRPAPSCCLAGVQRRSPTHSAVVLAGSKLAIIKSEVDILKSVEHPYIVKCFDAVDSPDKMYLVMEMCAAACAHSVLQAWA